MFIFLASWPDLHLEAYEHLQIVCGCWAENTNRSTRCAINNDNSGQTDAVTWRRTSWRISSLNNVHACLCWVCGGTGRPYVINLTLNYRKVSQESLQLCADKSASEHSQLRQWDTHLTGKHASRVHAMEIGMGPIICFLSFVLGSPFFWDCGHILNNRIWNLNHESQEDTKLLLIPSNAQTHSSVHDIILYIKLGQPSLSVGV